MSELQNPFNSEVPPPQPGDNGQRNRWYDPVPQAFNAIGWLLHFNPNVQSTVCGYLQPMIDDYAQKRQEKDMIKSMGSEKVLSLYQAQQKRRGLDQRQETFRVLSRIKTLNDSDRAAMVVHLHYIITGIRYYHGLCHEFNITPRTTDIRALTETYRKQGIRSVLVSLQDIRTKWQQQRGMTASAPTIDIPKPKPVAGTGMHRREF